MAPIFFPLFGNFSKSSRILTMKNWKRFWNSTYGLLILMWLLVWFKRPLPISWAKITASFTSIYLIKGFLMSFPTLNRISLYLKSLSLCCSIHVKCVEVLVIACIHTTIDDLLLCSDDFSKERNAHLMSLFM